jgi:glycosyltransferase involved in cell wall biosynthesis
MVIAYDVSHIRQHRAGIGRLATIQLQGLLAADRQRNYVLHGWAPDLDMERIQSFAQANVRLSVAQIPGVIKRLYWNWNALRIPPLETLIGPFDVFHGAEPLLPPVGKRKSIVTFNDSAYYKFPQFYGKWIARKWDYLYRRSLGKADAIIVLSESTRNDLIEMMALPPERIHIVRPPTDPVFSTERSPQEEADVRNRLSLPDQFLLFVGTIEPRKNIPRLVKAFEMFLERRKEPVSLIIVGRLGWLYEDILASINASPARKNIVLLNYVSDTDLAVLYRLASMFVFPTLYEGHGYPVVEAMSSGTPVITSNTSSLKEIGEGAAVLVDPENVGDICTAMQRLDREESLRQEMVSKGRERAAQFSVKNAVDAILTLYDVMEKSL